MSDLIRKPADGPPTITTGPGVAVDWSKLSDDARETLSEHTYSAETRRSYAWAWAKWVDWTATTPHKNGEPRPPLPASEYDVADYLDHLSRQTREDPRTGCVVPVSASLVEVAASAIACAHLIAGANYNRSHPAIRAMLRAVRRKLGMAPRNRRDALIAEQLAHVVAPLGDERLIEVRDRALVLVMFFSGRRRGSLSRLDADKDLKFGRDGLDIDFARVRTKTNREGRPEVVSIPFQPNERLCAARRLRVYLDRASIVEAAVFRSIDRHGNVGGRLGGAEINRIIQRLCGRAGLVGNYGAHSTRAGLVTELDARGVSPAQIGDHTGQTPATVLGYVRHAGRFRRNVARDIFGGGGT